MNKKSESSQEKFLTIVQKESIPTIVYLINGVQLRGIVRGFDTFTILLESPGRLLQTVYKSAITTISPMRPVRLYSPSDQASETLGTGSPRVINLAHSVDPQIRRSAD